MTRQAESKPRSRRRKLLYVFLWSVVIVVSGGFGTFQYFKYQFFAEKPNDLRFESELQAFDFRWSQNKFGEYYEPHAAMLFPVTIPGIDSQLYMQFDTGSPSSFLKIGAIKEMRRQGVEFNTTDQDGSVKINDLKIHVGANQVVLQPVSISSGELEIDWKNPNAINIIGTLGADFIDQKVCAIDFVNQEIRLFESRPQELNSLGTFKPFTFKGRRIMLPAMIDGVEMEVFYDSGCSAFGLLTSKYHFDRYAAPGSMEVCHNANRHGDPVFVHHRKCDLEVEFGETRIPVFRVSYAELYTFAQSTVGRMINGGFWGNKSFVESRSTLILDTRENEFLVHRQHSN